MRRGRGPVGEAQVASSSVLVAALLGVLLGSSVSLWSQRSSAEHVRAPAACPTCSVARADAVCGGAAAPTVSAGEPPGGTWRPAGRERAGNAKLQAVLARVAVNDEVMVAGAAHGAALLALLSRPVPYAVSNNALVTADGKYGMLQTWVACVQRAGVKNFLVIALDEHTGTRGHCARAFWKFDGSYLLRSERDGLDWGGKLARKLSCAG